MRCTGSCVSFAAAILHLRPVQMLPILAASHNKAAKPDAQPLSRQIGSDSVVGANLAVGEKSTVKRCTRTRRFAQLPAHFLTASVGRNVQIGKDCKIVACVLMEGVVLGDAYVPVCRFCSC
jgi:NDP-sugar pyrophosphorylase family protein